MSDESLNRVRSSIIFDQLTNDFKVRKEAVLQKLEEMGMKLQLTELMAFDLFVGEGTKAPLTRQNL